MNEDSSPFGGSRRHSVWLAGLAVLLLYVLGFNYYVPPSNGDDVTYYHGALSIAAGEGFKSQGSWIQDWPPGQSLLVAMAMKLLGSREYYVAKIVNLFAVLLALLLAHRLMVAEQRKLPAVACLLIAASPTSLVTGTAGQADFTFFALTMLFFLLLQRVSQSRTWLDAGLCGVVLGLASLTRWQGVLLGAGIVFQVVKQVRSKDKGSVSAPVLSAAVGAGIFLAWKYWLHVCEAAGTAASSNYEYQKTNLWWQPAPLELGGEILNLFTQFENVILRLFPSGNWLVSLTTVFFLAILTYGFCLRIRLHGRRPSDVYVLVTLAMYAVYAYKEARYAIPLAPFLLDYLFTGVAALVQKPKFLRLAVGCWFAGLLAIDGVLLFYGDGQTMGPRCQLLLNEERDFLRGYYLDLYDTCQNIKRTSPQAVLACDKFHTRIVRHYTGLETYFPGYAPDMDFDLFLEVQGVKFSKAMPSILQTELQRPPILAGRLANPQTQGKITVWHVD